MTRIILSIIILISFSTIANAQFTKGSALIGGTLSYSSNNSTYSYTSRETSNNVGNFNIAVGKAIRENAVFGINLNYQPSTYSYPAGSGEFKNTINNYGIGIFYRLYKNLGKEFYLFGEAGGGYIGFSSNTKDSLGNKLATGSGNGGQIYLSPGIAYKISKKFFLELSIPQMFSVSYSSNKSTTDPGFSSKSDAFNVNLNLNSNPLNSLGLGFRLVL